MWPAPPAVQLYSTSAGQNAGDGDRGEQVTGRLRRGLTDEELRAVARWVVRAYLEVERGYRDVRVLRPFLAPHLYFGLENAQKRPGSVPVTTRDVGGPSSTVSAPARATRLSSFAMPTAAGGPSRWCCDATTPARGR